MADSVGLALQEVLDSLNPAERLAFVLHDVFGVPSRRSPGYSTVPKPPPSNLPAGPGALRGLPEPDADLERQRAVVDAFFSASRDGDFEALL